MKTLITIAGWCIAAGVVGIVLVYFYGTWIIIKDAGRRGEDL